MSKTLLLEPFKKFSNVCFIGLADYKHQNAFLLEFFDNNSQISLGVKKIPNEHGKLITAACYNPNNSKLFFVDCESNFSYYILSANESNLSDFNYKNNSELAIKISKNMKVQELKTFLNSILVIIFSNGELWIVNSNLFKVLLKKKYNNPILKVEMLYESEDDIKFIVKTFKDNKIYYLTLDQEDLKELLKRNLNLIDPSNDEDDETETESDEDEDEDDNNSFDNDDDNNSFDNNDFNEDNQNKANPNLIQNNENVEINNEEKDYLEEENRIKKQLEDEDRRKKKEIEELKLKREEEKNQKELEKKQKINQMIKEKTK